MKEYIPYKENWSTSNNIWQTDFKEMDAIRHKEGHNKNINMIESNTVTNVSESENIAEKHKAKIDKI